MPHDELIKIYRRSDLHVYLSAAFVLSWSLLEIMATGTPILALDNEMMREVIDHESTGWLCNGSPDVLSNTINILNTL